MSYRRILGRRCSLAPRSGSARGWPLAAPPSGAAAGPRMDLSSANGSWGRYLTRYRGAYRGPGLRRRTIAEFDGFRFFRVLPPLAGTPVGEHGCRPPEVRPSPPPIGWLTGFMDTPRLCGLRPSQRLRPALPRLTFMCSALLTVPIV